MIFKLAVLLLLLLILVSLGSGVVFLVKDQGRTHRTRNALTVRIALSLALFVLLLVGYWAGWITPHGLAEGEPAGAAPTPGASTDLHRPAGEAP